MKLFRNIIALLLVFLMAFTAVSCKRKTNEPDDGLKDEENDEENENKDDGKKEEKDVEYSVTVVSPLGMPISDVRILVYSDAVPDSNVSTATAVTDSNGTAVFTGKENTPYSVRLVGYPQIYTAKSGSTREERYAIEGESTTVVLDMNDDYIPNGYDLGDTMPNFTVTDINGNEHELYDLLKEKKAVVLNFWYYSCNPCRSEFPALNTAYNKYKDKLEVLAINDYASDSLNNVKTYAQDKGLTLDMPLVRGEYGSKASLSQFDSFGYPTTVVIDRYGMFSFIHTGAVTNTADWNKLFDFFTSDSYTPTIVDKIEDIELDTLEYSVTVKSPLGKPMSGVKVFVYADSNGTSNVVGSPASTNSDGVVNLSLKKGREYSVKVVGYPSAFSAKNGNTREDRYILDGDITVTLEANANYAPSSYKLGDMMPNFTVTDVDGNTYELYEILKEKDAVALNFWFCACPYCVYEFPALNTAYNNYSDGIEILAINDTGDSVEKIQRFETNNSLTLDMPLVKVEYGSKASLSKFPSNGYPTTVIIDRYGTISFIHVGAMTNVDNWNKLFEFFTADDYTPTLVKSFDELA